MFERWSAFHGWAVRALHLCLRPFAARITFGTMNAAPVDWYRFRSALHVSGSMRCLTMPVALVRSTAITAYWQGQPFSRGQILIVPPGAHFDLSAAPELELVFFYLDSPRIRQLLSHHDCADGHPLSVRRSVLTPTAAQTRALDAMIESNLRSHRANASAQRVLESLVAPELRTPRDSDAGPAPVGPHCANQRVRHAQNARAYIDRRFRDNVTVTELADIAGVSARMLQLCFQDTFRTTPMRYLRARRLHAAYEALRNCRDPDTTTVTQIAVQCGFAHLGRFSAYYKSVYGELPNYTLSRSAESLR